jgi:hypothetical protein
MERARAFLLLCLGLVLLTLTHCLGTHQAIAQGTSWRIVGTELVVSGNVLYWEKDTGWVPMPTGPVSPSRIAAANRTGTNVVSIITTTGEGWIQNAIYPGGWGDIGPVPASTSVASASWGQLKARYK